MNPMGVLSLSAINDKTHTHTHWYSFASCPQRPTHTGHLLLPVCWCTASYTHAFPCPSVLLSSDSMVAEGGLNAILCNGHTHTHTHTIWGRKPFHEDISQLHASRVTTMRPFLHQDISHTRSRNITPISCIPTMRGFPFTCTVLSGPTAPCTWAAPTTEPTATCGCVVAGFTDGGTSYRVRA